MGQTGSSKICIFTQWTVKVEDIDRPQGLVDSSPLQQILTEAKALVSESVANHIAHIISLKQDLLFIKGQSFVFVLTWARNT